MHLLAHPRVRRCLIIGLLSAAALGAVGAAYRYGMKLLLEPTIHKIEVPATPSAASASQTKGSRSFSFWDEPRAMPKLEFADSEGRARSLADFRGRPILLNIWATWCVPCREEMPALDRLQATLENAGLLILPLSVDRQGATVVKPFYEEIGVTALGIYLDVTGSAAFKINSPGLPTTLFVDREGREIGRKIGPADWDDPKIVALIRQRFGLSDNSRIGGEL